MFSYPPPPPSSSSFQAILLRGTYVGVLVRAADGLMSTFTTMHYLYISYGKVQYHMKIVAATVRARAVVNEALIHIFAQQLPCMILQNA